MKNLNKYFIIIILIQISFFCKSQNSGFGGKRIFTEIEVVNGIEMPFSKLDIGYLINRKIVINCGFSYINSKYNQIYNKNEYLGKVGPSKMPDKANVNSNTFNIGIQYYLFNNEITLPSPYGFFFYCELGAGQINIDGNYYRSLIEFDKENNEIIDYKYEGLLFQSLQLGIGKNWLIKDWIYIGSKISYHSFLYNSSFSESIPSLASMGVRKTYGTNLIDFGRIAKNKSFMESLSPKYIPTGIKNFYSGISAFVTFGFIIY